MYNDEKNYLSNTLNNYSGSGHFVHKLKYNRIKNLNKIFIVKLNINSIINKFELLLLNLKIKIDVFLITEAKISKVFPNS